ncbi:hypothetical protein [Oceanivirga salmonicida]|nr:hypothetical protein [Oceanivirga salmonicida]
MKSWSIFLIAIGTIFIISYPIDNILLNLIMGLSFIIIGLILVIKGNKK